MRKFGISVSVTLLAAVLSTLAIASPTGSTDPTYSFNFTGPSTAEDPSTLNTIQLTGSGSFDTADSGTVIGSGSFTIFNSGGAVISRGTWKATGFVSFCSRGGPNPGLQGGVLVITVSLNGGAPVNMTVNCRVKGPSVPDNPCSPGPEGVAVGNFTNITGGHTLFHLNE